MKQRRKLTEQDGKGLASLGTKAAQQAWGERVGAGSSRPPSDPPCPLGRAQTSKWSLPNLLRGQERGRGAALTKEKEQGGRAVITGDLWGE